MRLPFGAQTAPAVFLRHAPPLVWKHLLISGRPTMPLAHRARLLPGPWNQPALQEFGFLSLENQQKRKPGPGRWVCSENSSADRTTSCPSQVRTRPSFKNADCAFGPCRVLGTQRKSAKALRAGGPGSGAQRSKSERPPERHPCHARHTPRG